MKAKRLAGLVLAAALSLSAFTGCGIDASETVATLGEQEVTVGIANFMCKYQKAFMDDTYVSYYGSKVWDMDMSGSGVTLGENLKESVMEYLHEMYVVKSHMEDYKVTLTDEENKAIADAVAAFMEANSADTLKEMGATEDTVKEMLELYTIQWKVYNEVIKETDREVSDEDANMRGISYISIGTAGAYNSQGTYEAYTETKKAELKATAEKMQKDLETKSLEDVAKAYDYEVTEDAYAKDDEGFDATLLKAMDALKEGEVSKMIETKSAIYFVRIDEDTDKKATEENREAIIAERESELYAKVLEGWMKDDGWTVNEDVLEKIDFHHVLTQKDPNAKETEKATDK